MKGMRFLAVVMALAGGGFLQAQQMPLYSQYMTNEMVINPAVAGLEDYGRLQLSFRNQWAGFNGSPATQVLSYNWRQRENVGMGALLFNDNTGGAIKNTGLAFSYAYHVPSEKGKLSLALSAKLNQYSLNGADLSPNNPDPIIVGSLETNLVPDATFGAYYRTGRFFAGLALANLLEMPIDVGVGPDSFNDLRRHYFLHAGYALEVGEEFELRPSILAKSITATGVQYDVNLRAVLKDKMWFGASYRMEDALVLMYGVNYKNCTVGYSYDLTLSDIGDYSNGSHELFLGYEVGVAEIIPEEKDSDGDGIPDDKDPCPDEKGPVATNGCPDGDGDGVEDQIDACPKTPGPSGNQGCPELTVEQKAVLDTAFSNLEFEFGKAIIKFESYTHLDRLGVMLVNNTTMNLTIKGHTDNVGSEEQNMKLSQARAEAVKTYLTDRGIDSGRIKVLYYGEEQPVASNDTEEGREKNRRVELVVGFN